MNDEALIGQLRDALAAAGRSEQITLADVKLDRRVAEALPGLPSRMDALSNEVQQIRVVLIGTTEDPEGVVHRVRRHAFFWNVIAWVTGVSLTGIIGWLVRGLLVAGGTAP